MIASADSRVDWAGTAHASAGADARIACLVPSITELLFSLALGERVVARTGFCVHPREAVRQVAKIGGTKDPDLDRLRALTPTHLIVNVDENRREVVDAARAFVPHVIVTHPRTLGENPRLYRLIGAVFGKRDAAETLCGRFLAAERRLRDAVGPLPIETVLYLIWKKPWMTAGGDTYIADVLASAGWNVVAADDARPRYPALGENDGAWVRAQRILLSSEPYAFRDRDARAVSAARNRPADVIDGEMTSWYGPRAIAGMDYLGTLRRRLAKP
ncbi:MAG: helical backbone metal receptor [Casimicrobiaceae bacterium]